MIIWKPITRYMKPRNEVGYHTDLGLEEEECLENYKELMEVLKVKTSKGKIRKIHLEICDEEFNKDGLTKEDI